MYLWGGVETLVKDYCLLIDKNKFDVVVLCLTRYGAPYEKQLEDAGVRVIYLSDCYSDKIKNGHSIFDRIYRQVVWYINVRKTILREKPDIIHAQFPWMDKYLYFARPLKTAKIFHTIHGEISVVFEGRKSLLGGMLSFKLLKKWAHENNFQFIALHEAMRKEINELFGVSNTLVLNNGIDFTHFNNALPKEFVRARENIPQDAFVVGHVGRFADQKNHSFLVEVFAEICRQNENAFLLMVGDGDLKEDIEAKLHQFGLENKYKILSNIPEVVDIMNAMDIFVFPSKYEGLPIVLIEAQKMCLPIVMSDTITQSTIISNLVTSMSLKDTPADWAKKAMTFRVEDAEYYNLEDWNMNNVIKKLENMYSA